MIQPRSLDIVDFSLGFTDDWFAVPCGSPDGRAWARDVVAGFAVGAEATGLLEYQLERVHANLSTTVGDTVTAMVWVPTPDTGYAAAVLCFQLADWAPGESPETMVQALESDQDVPPDEHPLITVNTWRGEIDAGEFVAARNVLIHREEGVLEGDVEERTTFVIFPPGCAQMVQLVFTAESIGAFYDMPAQTQVVVSSLQIKTEQRS